MSSAPADARPRPAVTPGSGFRPERVRALVADLLRQTIREARKEPPFPLIGRRGKVRAVCWLASRAATPWFDHLGLSQSRALRHLGWPDLARDVLAMDVVLEYAERRMLLEGIERFEAYRDGRRAG